MYSVYADNLCIYNDRLPDKTVKLIDPKLTLEDNSAGSFTFTMPPLNIGYSFIERLTTNIQVFKNGEEIWAGRVISEKRDFWNNRQITCEGELAFLNDTLQPQAKYNNITPRGFLEALVAVHNAKAASDHQFTVGTVTVTDPNDSIYRYTNFETTFECLNEKLIKKLGGHLVIRKENGVRYLDYLRDNDGSFPKVAHQVIRFGQNLLDFTRSWGMADYATAILPLGAHLDEEKPVDEQGHELTALDAYVTVESVNDGNLYISNETAVSNYGWIAKVVHWDDVTVPLNLKRKAEAYLADLQFDEITIELTAVDLRNMSIDYESIDFLDSVRVLSPPHGMDRYFMVTKMEIPLDRPENMQFKLGNKIRTSMSGAASSANADILERIENLPKSSTLLDLAKSNASDILNKATNGYITIAQDQNGSESLIIANNRDLSLADKMWKWNVNGLGYSSNGGRTFGTAITMDGSIVADYITTGTMNITQGLVIQTGVDADNHRLFMVDHTGARLYNSRMALGNDDIDILLDPMIGIAIGESGMYTIGPLDDVPTLDTTKTMFWIDTNGVLHLKGILEAASGSFAGDISAATGTFSGQISVGGRAPGTEGPDDPGEEAPFRVSQNGSVFMKGATISSDISTQSLFTGIIQATSGYFSGELRAASGTFRGDLVAAGGSFTGGLSIGGHTADPDDPEDHDIPPKFVVTQGGDVTSSGNFQTAGNVTLGGNVTLAGNIIWSTGADPNKTLYARSKLSTPSNRYDTYAEESESNWHRTYDGINDCYASYSHDGGLSWTAPVQLKASGTYILYARWLNYSPNAPYSMYPNESSSSWHREQNLEHDHCKSYGTISYEDGETWTWSDPVPIADLDGPRREIFAQKNFGTPIYTYEEYPVDDPSTWHRVRKQTDYYMSMSEDGGATWSAPIRIQSFLTMYIYCRNSTAPLPASQIDYVNLPDSSTTGWHKVYDTDDLYRSESVDGGETWGDPERVGAFKNYVLYKRTSGNAPSGDYDTFPATSTSGWHRTFDNTNDYFASYSYDGGSTWSSVVRIQGKDGSDASVTRGAIIAALKDQANAGDGIYSYTQDGESYIGVSATYIRSGYIDLDPDNVGGGIYFKNGNASIDGYKGSAGSTESDGIRMEYTSGGIVAVSNLGAKIAYGNNEIFASSSSIGTKGALYLNSSTISTPTSDNAVHAIRLVTDGKSGSTIALGIDDGAMLNMSSGSFVAQAFYKPNQTGNSQPRGSVSATSGGAAMKYGNFSSPTTQIYINSHSVVVEADLTNNGKFQSNVALTVSSDKRIKRNIHYDLDEYESFFDSLKPAVYQMSLGSQNQYHTGFIAQEVENALIQNGLTRDDFAGLSIVEGHNTQYDIDDVYGLAYTEFVSLNTYMIQKLKARVEELERRLESL